MEIDKEKLKLKLKKNNISISNKDLDSVIEIYQRLMKNVEEVSYSPKWVFEYIFDNSNDKQRFTIFKYLIYLYQNDLIRYVDFVSIDNAYIHQQMDVLGCLIKILKERIKVYQEYKDDYMYGYYMRYIRHFVEYMTITHASFSSSKTIDEKEQVILCRMFLIHFSTVKYGLHRKINDNFGENFQSLEDILNHYIGVIYYYFLGNDIINKDYDRAFKFLEYVDNNISIVLKKLFILGINKKSFLYQNINDIKVLFNFIDDQYKNFDKQEIVKMIK